MEFRVGFVKSTPFGSPDSEIARRVALRMEQLREQNAQAGINSPPRNFRDKPPSWTERVMKLELEKKSGRDSMPVFDDAEKQRMLTALWGAKGQSGKVADEKLSKEIRTFLTHMAISNTITPELKVKAPPPPPKARGWRSNGASSSPSPEPDEGDYVFNFSSPDELALCKYAAHMGFQFQSRSKDGIQLAINKLGFGDAKSEIEIYQSLGILDFNSKRKRVTCVYLRGETVYVMCKGADANVLPLIHYPDGDTEALQLRDHLDAQLSEMATKGLRTLVVAHAELPREWWFGSDSSSSSSSETSPRGMLEVYKSLNLPDRGAEKGHHRGKCRSECRICSGLLQIEMSAHLSLLGATAIEDQLQELVPEAIADFLTAGIKVWMLTGDKRETAKNIALACNLIDPDMEQIELLGSLSVEDMNRIVEVTGDWVRMCENRDTLRSMFDILDCGGDVVDGVRTGYITKEELRYFLIGLRVTGMDEFVHQRSLPREYHLRCRSDTL